MQKGHDGIGTEQNATDKRMQDAKKMLKDFTITSPEDKDVQLKVANVYKEICS